jgi:hypothetical protein
MHDSVASPSLGLGPAHNGGKGSSISPSSPSWERRESKKSELFEDILSVCLQLGQVNECWLDGEDSKTKEKVQCYMYVKKLLVDLTYLSPTCNSRTFVM